MLSFAAIALTLQLHASDSVMANGDPCPTKVYRSSNVLLQQINAASALAVIDESVIIDFNQWSNKSAIDKFFKSMGTDVSFHGQVVMLVDCNGKVKATQFIQSSDEKISQKLTQLINGSSINSSAKKDGKSVSSYTVVHLLYSADQLQQNPLFSNQ